MLQINWKMYCLNVNIVRKKKHLKMWLSSMHVSFSYVYFDSRNGIWEKGFRKFWSVWHASMGLEENFWAALS